ncbi:MAG: menaquinone biosynthetic enzyme MqnA/MqnD family protein [Flavisolibacter sp.]
MKKIRIGGVSYLNAKPLLYGIKNHPVFNEIELIEDFPARIAAMLINDEIDIGLIPVAATTKMQEWYIVSDYCIGCEGEVASVGIFSELPIEKIEKVFLDYQSRTSVNLARILLKEYWKKEVEFIDAKGEDFRDQLKGTTAGVVIGDRALEQRLRSPYMYDLGEAWKKHTGLPFVFAAWIANKKIAQSFIDLLNEANRDGLENINQIIKENPFKSFELDSYFKNYISYNLDVNKKKGLDLFLKKLESLK